LLVDFDKSRRYNQSALREDLIKKSLFLAVGLGIVASVILFVNRIFLGDAFTAEEAQHAMYGLWIWHDIRVFDLAGFIYDTNRQLVWPFMHSWLTAVFFLVFGANYLSARLMSLVIFGATLFLMYRFTTKLCDNTKNVCDPHGRRVGILAVILVLTSPLMLQYATMTMLEGLGALLFMLAAYLYVVSEEQKLAIEYIAFVFLLGLSLYVNYLYAYLLIPAFFVMTLAQLAPIALAAFRVERHGEHKAMHFIWWGYRKLIVLMVFLFLGGLWFSFSFSRKVLLLFNSIFKYSGGTVVTNIWESLLYYPKVIITQVSFSPWLGVFIFVSLFLPLVTARYRGLKTLYIYIWTVLLLLTMTIPTKAPQMMYIIIPFVFIVFSGVVVYFYDWLTAKNKQYGMLLLIVLFLPSLISLPALGRAYFPERAEHNLVNVLDYFEQTVPPDSPLLVMFNLKHLNLDGVRFHLKDWGGDVVDGTNLVESADGETYYLAIVLDETSPYQVEVVDDASIDEGMMAGLELFSSQRFESIGLTAQVFRKK